jgi:hypothetical protein
MSAIVPDSTYLRRLNSKMLQVLLQNYVQLIRSYHDIKISPSHSVISDQELFRKRDQKNLVKIEKQKFTYLR